MLENLRGRSVVMNVLHAAALAVVVMNGCAQVQTGPGWLLTVPPLSADGYADRSAPLSQWQTYGRYAAQTDCNSAIATVAVYTSQGVAMHKVKKALYHCG
jgi:hypothetical protein